MVRTKELKDGKLHFYNGNRKATTKEVRTFIKKNYDTFGNGEKLNADQRRYVGAVKGGKKRAENSLYNKQGRFLPANLQKKALERLGINIDALIAANDVKNIREVFKNNPEFKKSFDKLISTTGLPLFFNDENALKKIESFSGKDLFINGKKVDNETAYKKVSQYAKDLKRKFDLYEPGVAIAFIYTGTDKLEITLDEQVLKTGEDSRETIEGQSKIQLYHANKGNGKKNKK